MPWCTFYGIRVEKDHHPRDDNFCKAPDSLLKDVITCSDCDCYLDKRPLQCPRCYASWDGKTFTHFMGDESCQVCGTPLKK